jgi:hypothetical protein
MTAAIKIEFTLRDMSSKVEGTRSTVTCLDWYSVADWMKNEEEHNRDVIIHSWTYVHALRRVEV